MWTELFLEYLVAALADALVAALGWTIRKVRKWWRNRNKRNGDDA